MNTILINSKTAATVAKALLPVIKNKQNIDQGLGVLSRVLIKDGYLWATDRYVAVRIPLQELMDTHDSAEWPALEGKQLTLAQVEAIAKIRPNSTPSVLRVSDTEIILDNWELQVIHTYDSLTFPETVSQLFVENGNKELENVSQGLALTTTLTKIATAVKAITIIWEPSAKGRQLNVSLVGSKTIIDVVTINNIRN